MTNEELVEKYYSGDESAKEELYLQNRALIRSIVYETAARMHVPSFDILEDLQSEGSLAFLEVLEKRQYDPAVAKFTTYVYPFIAGAIRVFIMNNRYPTTEPNTENRIVSVSPVSEITYTDEDGNVCDLLDRLDLPSCFPSPEKDTFLNIEITILFGLFHKLSEAHQYIVGHFFGVFGMEKQPLKEIALHEMLTVNGTSKAKKQALEILRTQCEESMIARYRQARKAFRAAERTGM